MTDMPVTEDVLAPDLARLTAEFESTRRRLEEATSRLGALIASLPAAVLVEDQHRRIVLTNQAFTELFAIPVPPEALLGTDCSQAAEQSKHLFADPEGFVASVESALAGRVLVVGKEFGMLDGRVLVRDYVPVYRDGEYLGHMWLYRDITEQRVALRESARSRAELAEAQRVAHVGSWTWDPVTDVVAWSDELRDIYGLASDDPGPSLATSMRFYDPETLAEVTRLMNRCMATGEPYEIEYDITRFDGTRRHLIAHGEPVRDTSGTIVGLRGTAADITERHRVAEALRASEVRSQALVDQLQQADAAKDQFISTLSHELRNPLAAIATGLEQLREYASADPNSRWAFEIVERQSHHLSRIVDDLLDVTRMTRNTIVLKTEPVGLNELVWKIADDNQTFFDDRGVVLEIQTRPTPVQVLADPARLTQAIGNLLHNAAKFSDTGGTVVLAVELDHAAGQAVVTVTDHGRGIAADMLPNLFQPFMQADEALDRARGGLGLGLSIVKQIAELHGGTVTAESAGLGRGSRFTLRLPASRQAYPTLRPRPAATLRKSPPVTGVGRRRLRVLLIEDDEDLRTLTVFRLERLGHEVAAVGTGPDGLAAARRDRPDVVLCDIGLPGMVGYDVARAFRADDSLRAIPLVALTGYGQSDDIERALAAGFDHHLTKPVDVTALSSILAGIAHQHG